MRVIGFLLATLALTTVCADQTFRIVDNGGLTTAFRFNFSGTLVDTPILNVTVGEKITFQIEANLQSDTPIGFGLTDSFGGNPRDFSAAALGGLNTSSGCVPHPEATFQYSWYTSNVSNPCIITWTVVQPDPEFFYTSKYKAMVGRINATSTTTTTTSPPTSGTTTSPPTGTTTQAPTTTAPPTSTGKNSAALIVPGATAFILAAINALFA